MLEIAGCDDDQDTHLAVDHASEVFRSNCLTAQSLGGGSRHRDVDEQWRGPAQFPMRISQLQRWCHAGSVEVVVVILVAVLAAVE